MKYVGPFDVYLSLSNLRIDPSMWNQIWKINKSFEPTSKKLRATDGFDSNV